MRRKCVYSTVIGGVIWWTPGIVTGESENTYTVECWGMTGSTVSEMVKSNVIVLG